MSIIYIRLYKLIYPSELHTWDPGTVCAEFPILSISIFIYIYLNAVS
ncbi:hypothetical protein CLOHYLEM_04064 [[Clostridium] hylemonae DSM 15053]|uniref:Uncharacterized protein n=1 Tax=[Clostridium] hylemonae DSM 15053 TaxID=553973 RepID=C0BW35_9FIRM|nr:hypothetical protein CLOHYLEM_04064 [[Clostridium] hylemonae DSM 15053]